MKSDSREKKKCNLEHNELSKGMMSLDFENALIVSDKQENIIKKLSKEKLSWNELEKFESERNIFIQNEIKENVIQR